MCCPFPTKQRRHIKERDDLSLPVVPGGVEIGLGYRSLRPRAEDTPLGARPLRAYSHVLQHKRVPFSILLLDILIIFLVYRVLLEELNSSWLHCDESLRLGVLVCEEQRAYGRA